MKRKESPYDIGYFTGSYETKGITGMADNVICSRLGKCTRISDEARAGDDIDRGLSLLHTLERAGFEVRIHESD